jgi:hypothetical protein
MIIHVKKDPETGVQQIVRFSIHLQEVERNIPAIENVIKVDAVNLPKDFMVNFKNYCYKGGKITRFR